MKHVDQESVHGMHHDALAHSRHTGKDTMLTMTPNLHLPQAATPYTFQDASWGEEPETFVIHQWIHEATSASLPPATPTEAI